MKNLILPGLLLVGACAPVAEETPWGTGGGSRPAVATEESNVLQSGETMETSRPDESTASVAEDERTLAACPASPNCVRSGAGDEGHDVDALALSVAPSEAWPAVRAAVSAIPRCKVVTLTDTYLHAECRTALLRFVDDLELALDAASNSIAVRSASRVGYWDFGVNRRRVEKLRRMLSARGVVAGER